MANIVAIQELVNGPRNLVLKLDIEGDGSNEIDEKLVEVGAYDCTEVRLDGIRGHVDGFDLNLVWDGTTRAPLFKIPNSLHSYIDLNWANIGGLINPKVANYTGDVAITSNGLESGEVASLEFHFVKKHYEAPR